MQASLRNTPSNYQHYHHHDHDSNNHHRQHLDHNQHLPHQEQQTQRHDNNSSSSSNNNNNNDVDDDGGGGDDNDNNNNNNNNSNNNNKNTDNNNSAGNDNQHLNQELDQLGNQLQPQQQQHYGLEPYGQAPLTIADPQQQQQHYNDNALAAHHQHHQHVHHQLLQQQQQQHHLYSGQIEPLRGVQLLQTPSCGPEDDDENHYFPAHHGLINNDNNHLNQHQQQQQQIQYHHHHHQYPATQGDHPGSVLQPVEQHPHNHHHQLQQQQQHYGPGQQVYVCYAGTPLEPANLASSHDPAATGPPYHQHLHHQAPQQQQQQQQPAHEKMPISVNYGLYFSEQSLASVDCTLGESAPAAGNNDEASLPASAAVFYNLPQAAYLSQQQQQQQQQQPQEASVYQTLDAAAPVVVQPEQQQLQQQQSHRQGPQADQSETRSVAISGEPAAYGLAPEAPDSSRAHFGAAPEDHAPALGAYHVLEARDLNHGHALEHESCNLAGEQVVGAQVHYYQPHPHPHPHHHHHQHQHQHQQPQLQLQLQLQLQPQHHGQNMDEQQEAPAGGGPPEEQQRTASGFNAELMAVPAQQQQQHQQHHNHHHQTELNDRELYAGLSFVSVETRNGHQAATTSGAVSPTCSNYSSSSELAESLDSTLTRDERKAREANIPLSYHEIVNLSIDQFNEHVAKFSFTEAQLTLMKDIRRRGKNKVAAQTCRKRKMEQISELQQEVNQLIERKVALTYERGQLECEHNRLARDYEKMCEIIRQHLDSRRAEREAEQDEVEREEREARELASAEGPQSRPATNNQLENGCHQSHLQHQHQHHHHNLHHHHLNAHHQQLNHQLVVNADHLLDEPSAFAQQARGISGETKLLAM